MIRIACDARVVYSSSRRGTGKNLIDLYRGVAGIRPGWRFVMLHQAEGGDDPFAGLANVEHRRIDIPGDRWDMWQQVRLPLAAKLAGADVLHCPANTGPRFPLTPMVVTIHDLIPLEPGSGHANPQAWGRNVGQAARKARWIVTPSEFSKRQIVEAFGVSADKIRVNYWAPDEQCRLVTDPAELARVRQKYGVEAGRPMVLGFGAADPRKNTTRILQAWAGLPVQLRREWALVLVGFQQSVLDGVRRQARDLGLEGGCFLHGFVPEAELPALMSAAEVLCYPSLSEGFGLPVLDAFVCESAVLTSSVTSLPEVAGDAAVLVDPRDEQSIGEGLRSLLADAGARKQLVQRGRERVKAFTWQACAERMCRVFEEVIGEE